jgi:hypothetical protein
VIRVRCTPAMLWTGLGISVLAGAASKTLEFVNPGSPVLHFGSNFYGPLYIIANAVSFYYCRKICSDHHDPSTMHLAWLLMAASCATAIVRHGYEWTTYLLGWIDSPLRTSVVSLRQIPTVLAMVFMTAGLLAMWSSFAAVGLGVRFRWRDAVLPLIILALTAADLSHRQNMWDAGSEYPLMRYLQMLSPISLALPALLGLVLQRICQEMRGGQFADFLRFLVWSLLLRLASLLTTFSPGLSHVGVIAIAGTAAFWAAPWLFALAVLRRWRIAESLSEMAELYERHPEVEFAKLVSPRVKT